MTGRRGEVWLPGSEGGDRFWFHTLRNCFITVPDQELMQPPSLTKQLVNHTWPADVVKGHAVDRAIALLRDVGRHC